MEKIDRPLIVPKELMTLDAGTEKNIEIFNDMLKQTEKLIKEGKIK